MSGLEEAAIAFSTDISGVKSAASESSSAPVEVMFGKLGELEVDDDSPVVGGGDDLPLKVKGKQAETPEEEDEDVDPIYGIDPDEEEAPKAKKGSYEDEEEDEDEDEDDDENVKEFDLASIDEDAVVEIVVDNEPTKVKLKEAINGYIRTETFHRRLNEVNEARQEVVKAGEIVTANQTRALQMIDEVGEALHSLMPAEPDWDKLYAEDPKRARDTQKQFEGLRNHLKGLADKRAEMVKSVGETTATQRINYVKSEMAKIDKANPHWVDPKKKEIDLKSMVRTARTVGYDDQEISEIFDSRAFAVLLKASKYDRMMAAKPKVRKIGKTPATPGMGNTRTVQKGLAKASKDLARTGSVEAAGNLFTEMLRKK